jgi:uncharacterized protein with NRDE domain
VCVLAFAWKTNPEYPLIFVSNRDEYHSRPSKSLERWPNTSVYAPRDLKGGGTWLGFTADGRWAAITNFRDGIKQIEKPISRGILVKDFLLSSASPKQYAEEISHKVQTFNGFNLLVGDIESIEYISNRRESDHVFAETLTEPGIYTLSNHLLNTPWPKTVSLRETFTKALVQNETVDLRDYIELLQSTETYDHERLPNTGIPSELEQKLSPIFIVANEYGTRSSTAMKFNRREHSIQILEVQYDSDGAANQKTRFNFEVNHL